MFAKSKLICLITISLMVTSSTTTNVIINNSPALSSLPLPDGINNQNLSDTNNSWLSKIKSFFGFHVENIQDKLEATQIQNSSNNDSPSQKKLKNKTLNAVSHDTLEDNDIELPDILKAMEIHNTNNGKLYSTPNQNPYSQDNSKADYNSTQINQTIKEHNNINDPYITLPEPITLLSEQHNTYTQNFFKNSEVINNSNQPDNTNNKLVAQTQDSNSKKLQEKNISLAPTSNQQKANNSQTLETQPLLAINENNASLLAQVHVNDNSKDTKINSGDNSLTLNKSFIPLIDNYVQSQSDNSNYTDNAITAYSSINNNIIQRLLNNNKFSTTNNDYFSSTISKDDTNAINLNILDINEDNNLESKVDEHTKDNHSSNALPTIEQQDSSNTKNEIIEPAPAQTLVSSQANTSNLEQVYTNDSTNDSIDIQTDPINLAIKDKINNKTRDNVELSMFIDRELIILTAENDDIELGELTDKAKLKLLEDWKYIKLIEKEINYRKEASKRQAVNNIIQYHRTKEKKVQESYISKCVNNK
ncbi:hypothetical protein OCHUTO_0102 [Orientia chuto str. Dubai]|uniref:Secreted protein n=1 Tax=Orientia chuto str. Dubai TaxID=1359168 RepID=A0A0F3MNL6_9RICK|nr:hypothetical protein [Candidatus Orientia mediorientalis]KJV57251.1 hypothetical protein OCHUTO_0102 [Orientia chuto str. Dubai]